MAKLVYSFERMRGVDVPEKVVEIFTLNEETYIRFVVFDKDNHEQVKMSLSKEEARAIFAFLHEQGIV